jgi:malonyl CoA-acyl carrier protein transacylase
VRWDAVLDRLDGAAGEPLVAALRACTGVTDWSAVRPEDTRLAQPAVLVAGLLGRSDADADEVVAVVGHSFGELAALVAAGVLAVDDALRLARLRGELGAEVQAATGGGMLAVVSVDAAAVEELRQEALAAVGGTCELAVLNHRLQVVLSGDLDALRWIEARAEGLGGRAHLLPIGGPYHTPFMAEAAMTYRQAAAAVTWAAPTWPVVFSTRSAPLSPDDDLSILPDVLADGLVRPVDWPRALGLARAAGAERGLDLGPGNVLAKIGRRAGLAFDALWLPPVEPDAPPSAPGP